METSQIPLFTAQRATCAYPISETYGSSPRYLYYALLLASVLSRWQGWLTHVVLGAAAAYAGSAAIHTFILVAGIHKLPNAESVSIPFIKAPTNLSASLPSLVTGRETISIQPATLELDADAVLAIVVTGYLIFLPMQCWSRVAHSGRARYLVLLMWSMLMLAGTVCALVYWPILNASPEQFMFCIPGFPSNEAVNNDGWIPELMKSSWNETIWNIFSNRTVWESLNDNCFYPCFNTTQVLRKPSSLNAEPSTFANSPHVTLAGESTVQYRQAYTYTLITTSTVTNLFLLLLRIFQCQSRIPYSNVRLIWPDRKAILGNFRKDLRKTNNLSSYSRDGQEQKFSNRKGAWRLLPKCRLWCSILLDVGIASVLFFSMIISPLTLIAFIIWTEWYIHEDGPPSESAQQVGQWSPLVALALVLISVVVLKLKHKIAPRNELEHDIVELKDKLSELEKMVDAKSST